MLLLGGITVIVTSLKTYTLVPADVLPAKETLVFFSSADEQLLRRYAAWFPALRDLPVADIPRTVAVVRTPEWGDIVVVFARRPVAPGLLPTDDGWTSVEKGPLLVAVSSPAVLPLLDAPMQPLRSSKAFALLTRKEDDRQPWIFMQRRFLPASATLGDVVLDTILLRDVTHVGILPYGPSDPAAERTGSATSLASDDGSGMTVRFFPSGTERRALSLPAAAEFSPLSIALAQPADILQTLYRELPAGEHVLFESRMLTFCATLFGDDVSFTYDVLPLLERPARLSLSRTGSGTLAWLLQGSTADAGTRITRLHEAFRGSRTPARTVTRVFDSGRYTFRNVRDDTQMIADTETALGNMRLRRTVHAVQGEFCSALRGEEFLLSTDCATLERAVLAKLQGPGTSALAGGTLLRSALPSLVSAPLPVLLGADSLLLPVHQGPLQWSLSRQGDMLTLTLLPLPQKNDRGTE